MNMYNKMRGIMYTEVLIYIYLHAYIYIYQHELNTFIFRVQIIL